jgi:drug/metabolite transporter (DMT)-like permease
MPNATALRTIILTTLAMVAFAGNSLLCRLALKQTAIDAASFTGIRMVAATLVLWLIVLGRNRNVAHEGNWLSAWALFAYAALFSFAYIDLPAAAGALILFGSVQTTMIGYGFLSGERLRGKQVVGLMMALCGLGGLMLPGLSAPPLFSSVLMVGAGIAWGIYSLRGRGAGDPTKVTAGNFLRTVPMTAALSLVMSRGTVLDAPGVIYAILSGGLTSGIGYAIWYAALPNLRASQAATVQLSVPVIAALGGVLLIGELLTLRLVLASATILFGIALVVLEKAKRS